MEGAMAKRRASTQPPMPATPLLLAEYLLANPRYSTTISGQPFYSSHLESAAAGHIVLFVSPTFTNQVLADIGNEIHVDGTFSVVPKMFRQLCTVHVEAYDYVLYFIMSVLWNLPSRSIIWLPFVLRLSLVARGLALVGGNGFNRNQKLFKKNKSKLVNEIMDYLDAVTERPTKVNIMDVFGGLFG